MSLQQTLTAVSPAGNVVEVVNTSRAETARQREYIDYLRSQRWRTLARAVRMRAKERCEICLWAYGEECAHLTYERIFNERITDLLWVCKKCHRELDNTE
jgi:hypothetical protein